MVRPDGQQLTEQTGRGRLSDGNRSCDPNHERRTLHRQMKELVRRIVQLAGVQEVAAQQPSERQVHLTDVQHAGWIA